MTKYTFGKKKSKQPLSSRHIVSILTFTLPLIGLYILVLVYAPRISFIPFPESKIDPVKFSLEVDAISIPKIGVKIPYYSGHQSVLEKGAWHRFPERGDPKNGGNFILSAHRFQLGMTPSGTKVKSPFYNLHMLEEGDDISITYGSNTYKYKVSRKYDVERTAVEIEAPSQDAKLTLYSCSFKGEKAGRIVIEARQIN